MSELLTFLTSSEEQFRRNRLAALYSDFRHLRTTNPDGFTANVEAWRKGLTDAAKGGHIRSLAATGDRLLLKVDKELLSALETKEWGRPLALGTVIRDAVSRKEMIPSEDFLASKRSIYHKSWSVAPWSLVSWGLTQLGLIGTLDGEDALPLGKYVILANVEAASKHVTQHAVGQTSHTDRIYSKKQFRETYANALGAQNDMSDSDMDVLLKFMERDQSLLAYDGQTIKLRGPSETVTMNITSEDSTIASLKTLMGDLRAQLEVLGQRVERLSEETQAAVARKNRVSALAALRSKKLAESNILRQSATLGQLEEVYSKIGQAADQVELVRILEGSTGVLKSLNAETGGIDRVEDVLYELSEQMSKVEEVGSSVAGVSAGPWADETEVDLELEAMEREDREKTADSERLEKEERERKEETETKRKLENLEAAERQVTREDQRVVQRLHEAESLDKAINDTTLELGQVSLGR